MSLHAESAYSLIPKKPGDKEKAHSAEVEEAANHYRAQHAGIAPYFLGPQAENHDFFSGYINKILSEHKRARETYHGCSDPSGSDDGRFITSAMQSHPSFVASQQRLETELNNLFSLLMQHSVPFWSPRYNAHMLMDTSIPAILGYITTMVFNPNNVSLEASPVTTMLEIEAGEQLCKMLGFRLQEGTTLPGFPGEMEGPLFEGERVAWGHITCGGTAANLEGIWAARNLKFYPLAILNAMAPGEDLEFIAPTFMVTTCKDPDHPVLFSKLTTWELLNLTPDEVLDIPDKLYRAYGISSAYLQKIMKKHSIQSVGKDEIERQYGIKPMHWMVSATNHYSWPKGCALTGIGSRNMIGVRIDNEACLDLAHLREILEEHVENEVGVYAVTAIIGSTEEGAVDNLKGILALRSEFQKKGLSFVLHVDAAWGGYFASMVPHKEERDVGLVASHRLRAHVEEAYRHIKFADSVTIDPHKSGYVPYPAGALCYRDGRMRYLVTWTSPYIAREHQPESIGVFGVEGSKPGAAAVATWLSNSVIGMRGDGYGVLLGEASFSCSRLSAHWAAMSTDDDVFKVVPFNLLPSERKAGCTPADIEAERKFIREHILPLQNIDLLSDPKALGLLRELGSDLIINCFAVNFRLSNGEWNTSVEEANYLNKRIVKRLSYVDPKQDLSSVEFFLTSTEFGHEYGDCAKNFKRRLGLDVNDDADLFVLRNVVMSPFPTAGNFVTMLADIFRKIVEEEVKVCQLRNSIDPAIHRFTIQGTSSDGKVFLAYEPFFHEADCLTQLIVSADMAPAALSAYLDRRSTTTRYATFHVATTEKVRLSDILSAGHFSGTMYKADVTKDLWTFPSANFQNVRIIKNRSLSDRCQDVTYPVSYTPFYLYGTAAAGDQHISHVLTRAPNAMFLADNIALSLSTPLSSLASELSNGCILTATTIFEQSRQPFSPATTNAPHPADPAFFFLPDRTLEVSVYADPNGPEASGPGLLADLELDKPLATGTMTLAGSVYVDAKHINEDGLDGLLWNGSGWEAPEKETSEKETPAAGCPGMGAGGVGGGIGIGIGLSGHGIQVSAGVEAGQGGVEHHLAVKAGLRRVPARRGLLGLWKDEVHGALGQR